MDVYPFSDNTSKVALRAVSEASVRTKRGAPEQAVSVEMVR